jgi:hypothetical protein
MFLQLESLHAHVVNGYGGPDQTPSARSRSSQANLRAKLTSAGISSDSDEASEEDSELCRDVDPMRSPVEISMNGGHNSAGESQGGRNEGRQGTSQRSINPNSGRARSSHLELFALSMNQKK